MSINEEELKKRLAALQASYTERLRERVADILHEVRPVLEGTWSNEQAGVAARLAHNLAGTGQTFGFPAVGEAARTVENLLYGWQGDTGPTGRYRTTLLEAVDALVTASRAAGIDVASPPFHLPEV